MDQGAYCGEGPNLKQLEESLDRAGGYTDEGEGMSTLDSWKREQGFLGESEYGIKPE